MRKCPIRFGRILMFLILAGSLLAKIGFCTTMKPVSIATLARHAGTIVVGKVKSIESEWNEDRSVIFTHINIAAEEFYKGDSMEKEITVKLLGGTMSDTTLRVAGAPGFTQGEDVFLFLRTLDDNYFAVDGLSQGKFSVEVDSATGKKMLRNDLSEIFFLEPYKERGKRTVDFQDMVTQIRKALQNVDADKK